MKLEEIIKELNSKEDIIILNRGEMETLSMYIKQLEKVIDTEIK